MQHGEETTSSCGIEFNPLPRSLYSAVSPKAVFYGKLEVRSEQTRRLPRLGPKCEVSQILGEVVSIDSGGHLSKPEESSDNQRTFRYYRWKLEEKAGRLSLCHNSGDNDQSEESEVTAMAAVAAVADDGDDVMSAVTMAALAFLKRERRRNDRGK